MYTRFANRCALTIGAASAFLAGCGVSQPSLDGPAVLPRNSSIATRSVRAAHSRILFQHIVLVVQESRTFNDLFAAYPGGHGTTVGKVAKDQTCGIGKSESIPLTEEKLTAPTSLGTDYPAYLTAYNNGKMSGFDKIGRECTNPYQYVDPKDVRPYWDLAEQYALADHMFQTQGSDDFTAHQDLIRGGTEINPTESIIDDPTYTPWGCDARLGTATNVITRNGEYERFKGPYPCFTYRTLRDLLDAKSISWKYYAPPAPLYPGAQWNAFAAIKAVREGPEWKTNIAPTTAFLRDVRKNELPAMSWVIPEPDDSDRPGFPQDNGPAWIASIVNAIGESSYWESTAIVIVWDDWGGYYDPIRPPESNDQGGPGFRVPMIVVSPYVPRGEIANTVYGFGSIVRFIENNWRLGRLGTTDKTSTSIGDIFNFKQSPRSFTKIQ